MQVVNSLYIRSSEDNYDAYDVIWMSYLYPIQTMCPLESCFVKIAFKSVTHKMFKRHLWCLVHHLNILCTLNLSSVWTGTKPSLFNNSLQQKLVINPSIDLRCNSVDWFLYESSIHFTAELPYHREM